MWYKLGVVIALVVITWLICLITGKNKRQMRQIPPNMNILCVPPVRRYIMYAMGNLIIIFVGIASVFYIMAGAPKEARGYWLLCVILSIVCWCLMIVLGNFMAKDRVYFNEDYMQIGKPLKKLRTVYWYEIGKVESSVEHTIQLYDRDGNKLVHANQNMINYNLFYNTVRRECGSYFTDYNGIN